MADFAAIRFQPSRPLLRELSADRLNSILAEIRRNKPLPGRGITVRQTGQGTAIDLAASIPRGGGTSTPATSQPWDLIVRVDPDSPDPEEPDYLVSVRPGTLNGILPSNWDIEHPVANGDPTQYAKAVVTVVGNNISEVQIVIDENEPAIQEAQLFGVEASVEFLFGTITNGQATRITGEGNIIVAPRTWLIADSDPPAQPGESPYQIYYNLLEL